MIKREEMDEMLRDVFYRSAHSLFGVVGSPISKEAIEAAFPGSFPGKDDLVEFYLHNNGGSRSAHGCLVHCGNPTHRVPYDRLDEMRIEGFFSIPHNPEEKMIKYRSMAKYYKSRVQNFADVPEIKAFLDNHRPIASDHSGDDCWINMQSGHIVYTAWIRWREGPITIASSFRDFVFNFWINGSGGCPTSE